MYIFIYYNNISIILLPFSVFGYICFPRKGTLTDAGNGDGGGQQIIKNHLKIVFFYIFPPGREL